MEPSKRVGIYSDCFINGINFLNIKRHDAHRVTQNSVVCVEGSHKDKDIIFRNGSSVPQPCLTPYPTPHKLAKCPFINPILKQPNSNHV